jgi:TM2 domain-containing membrane protein YozV
MMSDQPYSYDPSAEPTYSQQHPSAQYPPGQVPTGPYPYPMATQVAAKNPAVALLVSFLIPGVGSMMNGEVGKGIGILVGYLVSLLLTLVFIGVIGVFGFWIWGMVDAYQGAQKWNARHGILS